MLPYESRRRGHRHIPELGGGMTTSSRMLSPCWTTWVSAHTTAVLEISLAAARTATTTTAPAPRPFSAALCGCRTEAAAALSFISERQELLPADSERLPVRKGNKQTNRARGRSEPESATTPTRDREGNGAAQPRTHRSSLGRTLMPQEADEAMVLQNQWPLGASVQCQITGRQKKKTSKKQSIEVKKEANGWG